ncbi:MAG TPA: tryptophan synthase subunit alpha, partial [Nitrososphaerales archaeon]|nr:tryptophan synthase subunit alpha [Nitrososphaerales archaeon]
MSEISKAFAGLAGSEGALVTYIMGGDPDPDTCSKVIDAVVAGGADILELGIPFSDPIADGKLIQAAAVRALSAGTTPRRVLELAKNAKEKHHVPVALMTYFNIFYSQGFENFLRLAKSHSVDGIIIPDLPLDEASRYARISRRMGVDNILLAAPTTSAGRMRMLASNTSGFL